MPGIITDEAGILDSLILYIILSPVADNRKPHNQIQAGINQHQNRTQSKRGTHQMQLYHSIDRRAIALYRIKEIIGKINKEKENQKESKRRGKKKKTGTPSRRGG